MSDVSKFVVGTYEFELAPLPLKQQMKGWSIVGALILPIFVGGGGLSLEGIQGALAGVDRIGDLFDMFAARAKVNWNGSGMVELPAFSDQVFQRRSDLLLAFLAECVAAEYGSFLDERGRTVLTQVERRFDSLLG